MKTDKKIVTIVRSKWARGDKRPDRNKLRNSDGTQCCLGFVCRALGAKVSQVYTVALPYGVDLKAAKPQWLIGLEGQAAAINDEADMTARRRETALKKLFADSPIALKFVP